MQINKYVALTTISSIISPILTLLSLCLQLNKGVTRGANLIVSLLSGYLSMNYIPSFTNDKARYIDRFNRFSEYSFSDLLDYYETYGSPDYVFDFVIYLISSTGLPFPFLFFILSFLSVYLLLTACIKIINSTVHFESVKHKLILYTLLVSSFSLPSLLSGVRFFLAGSIFLWFIYKYYISRKAFQSILLLVLAISTHFSFSYLIIPILLSSSKVFDKASIWVLLLSILCFFIPINMVDIIVNLFYLPESYSMKVNAYNDTETVGSNLYLILNQLRFIWFYAFLLFLLLQAKKVNVRKDTLYFLLSYLFASVNVMFSVPTVFFRYAGFLKILAALYLYILFVKKRINKNVFYLLVVVFIFSFYIDAMLIMSRLSASYSFLEILSYFSIIFKDSSEYLPQN